MAIIRIGIVLDTRGGAAASHADALSHERGRPDRERQKVDVVDPSAGPGAIVRLFHLALDRPVSGVMNGVSPNPVVNAEFTRTLAAAVHRPALFPVPGFALKALFGEMSEILLASQRVAPKAAEAQNFPFRFPQLEAALADLLK